MLYIHVVIILKQPPNKLYRKIHSKPLSTSKNGILKMFKLLTGRQEKKNKRMKIEKRNKK